MKTAGRPSFAQRAMRILLARSVDEAFGGVASVVGNLARHLRERGHEVSFLHFGDRNTLEPVTTQWGFPAFKLRLRQPYWPPHPVRSQLAFACTLPHTLYQLGRLIRRERIDIVNVHYPEDAFVHLSLCRRFLPIKLVTSVHGADLFPDGQRRRRYSRSLSSLLSTADLVVAPSRSFLSDCLGVFPSLETQSCVIYNGIDLAELPPLVRRAKPAREARSLLCIAALCYKKGLDVLIRAFAELADLDPPPRLILVGDGPLRGDLETLVGRMALQARVSFVGEQRRDQVARLLSSCELLVLPSRSEPFGLAVIEAMAFSKPVVASAVGAMPEIIEDGRSGILVEPDDPDALARALRTVLSDPGLGQRLGAEGRLRVRERFRHEIMGERYEREFQRLLSVA